MSKCQMVKNVNRKPKSYTSMNGTNKEGKKCDKLLTNLDMIVGSFVNEI